MAGIVYMVQTKSKWRKKIEQIVEACFYEKPKDGLTTRTAQRLYGTILENSVTRLEKFSACAYAHFLSYGLNLREREEYTFQAIDLGNISIVPLNILQKTGGGGVHMDDASGSKKRRTD